MARSVVEKKEHQSVSRKGEERGGGGGGGRMKWILYVWNGEEVIVV